MATGRIPTTANSPLTAKGDLFTFSTGSAKLAVGNNGETLVADSSTATGLAYREDYAAGKNKIINGDFYVNQRNFTSTTTDATFGFDRFPLLYSGGTCTYSAETFTLGAAPVAGYEGKNFARLVSASQSTAGHFCATSQKIEDVRTFAGQTVTFSFWAKASTGTPNIGVAMQQNFGSGGSPSSEVITSPAIQAITASWARYSFTVSVPSISGKTIGTTANTSYLGAWIFTSAGTTISGLGYPAVGIQNVTVDIWGVQIEAGSIATAFQTATGTTQGELAACQRYYVRYNAGTSNYVPLTPLGFSTSTTNVTLTFQYPVVLRGQASAVDYANLSVYGGSGGVFISVSSLTLTRSSTMMAELAAAVTGATNNNVYRLQPNNAVGYIGFTAEL